MRLLLLILAVTAAWGLPTSHSDGQITAQHSSRTVRSVTIDNLKPRLDRNGAIVDVHDGSIQRFHNKGPYYVHGAQYGLCKEPAGQGCDQTSDHCGFRLDHNISIWRSDDLSSGSWEYAGNAVPITVRPEGTVFRPHLVFNPNTNLYVLWWNWVAPNGTYMGYAVATSSEPDRGFAMRNQIVNVTRMAGHPGDFDLFVDSEGTGFVIYSSGYYTSIEKLTRDFIYSTGESAVAGPGGSLLFPEYFCEAPAIFKRKNLYYALFGYCCCYCYQGSGIMVHTATDMMGPWTVQPGDLACHTAAADKSVNPVRYGVHAEPTPGQGCQYKNLPTSVVRSQQNYVIEVQTPTGTEYIWTGDRWQQAPDGIKGHDPQFWVPLKFNEDGSIQRIEWVDSFTLDVVVSN